MIYTGIDIMYHIIFIQFAFNFNVVKEASYYENKKIIETC